MYEVTFIFFTSSYFSIAGKDRVAPPKVKQKKKCWFLRRRNERTDVIPLTKLNRTLLTSSESYVGGRYSRRTSVWTLKEIDVSILRRSRSEVKFTYFANLSYSTLIFVVLENYSKYDTVISKCLRNFNLPFLRRCSKLIIVHQKILPAVRSWHTSTSSEISVLSPSYYAVFSRLFVIPTVLHSVVRFFSLQ